MDIESPTNEGRPLSPHGVMGGNIVDYRIARSRLEAAGRIDDTTRSFVTIADRLASSAEVVAERDEAMGALLGGRDGLRSDRFLERVRAANRGRVIPFLRPDIEPEPEPTSAARAA